MNRKLRRHWRSLGLAAAALFLATTPALAAAHIDCPLRDAPYALDTPVMDILLKPEAVAALEQAVPGISQRMPRQFASTQAPSFSAIMSLHQIAGYGLIPADKVAGLDAALRALPITDTDRQARCARYDVERPHFTLPAGRPRVLLFEKMTGFRDGPSVEAAHAAFVDMAARNHWAIVATDRGGAINPSTLRQFDVVIWNNVSGDVLTLTQRRALQSYMEHGGGFVGVHGSAGDPVYFWDWYADTLIGARFIGHPGSPQFQTATVSIADHRSGIGAGLPASWPLLEEWYSFDRNPADGGATIVATIDEKDYNTIGFGGRSVAMGYHPIAWRRFIGDGRSFYSAIGHRPENYDQPQAAALLANGIAWAMRPKGRKHD